MKERDRDIIRRKKELRRYIARLIQPLSKQELATEGAKVCATIASLSVWDETRTVLAFMPTSDEVDIADILDRAIRDGKRLAIPRIANDTLRFHSIGSIEEAGERKAYGIQEPRGDAPVIEFTDPALYPILVITPGTAFDLAGGRLGRGKGFYDRAFREIAVKSHDAVGSGRLSSVDRGKTEAATRWSLSGATHGSATSVAVCLAFQIVDHVPRDENDVDVDLVVSERGVEYLASGLVR